MDDGTMGFGCAAFLPYHSLPRKKYKDGKALSNDALLSIPLLGHISIQAYSITNRE